MALYVLNRTYVHRSTSGVVSFVKGEPMWVPPTMEKEVIAIGAERADGDTPDVLEDAAPARKQFSQIERQDEIFAAFNILIERNNSKDFTGAGVPTVKAVEKIIDSAIEADRGEIEALWVEYKVKLAEGN